MPATSVVSPRFCLTTPRMKRGTTNSPAANSATKKPISLPIVSANSPGDRSLPDATAVRIASSKIAIMSSNTSTANVTSTKPPRTFCSSNALATSIVDEMPRHAPANRLSTSVQPNRRPTRYPSEIIRPTSIIAVSPPATPIRAIFRRLNSMPIVNISSITPSSESACVRARLSSPPMTMPGTCGPRMIPATRYPSTGGCRSLCETMLVTAAVPRMMPRSWTKCAIPADIGPASLHELARRDHPPAASDSSGGATATSSSSVPVSMR